MPPFLRNVQRLTLELLTVGADWFPFVEAKMIQNLRIFSKLRSLNTVFLIICSTMFVSTNCAEIVSGGVKYMVVIDAGSSGSRVHIYKYSFSDEDSIFPSIELPDKKKKISPGLSTFSANPQVLGGTFQLS